MGTPFITFLGPSRLEGYRAGKPRELQPSCIPSPFLDAMEVREAVFVSEQGVPLENEFDSDDCRSCHWVIYASVNKTEEVEVRDEDGNVVKPRKSSTRSTPIGTIRLVPFPHEPHPVVNGKYWNNVLEGQGNSSSEPELVSAMKPYIIDRPTSFHDGKEPYVKIGRLAVVKEFRGHRLAGLLIQAVLAWLKKNPTYFNPSIKELGLENMAVSNERDIPKWQGLVCIHAQESVTAFWRKWGFEIDEGMGKWWEEGIPHVGMFHRLEVDADQIRI
jgi:predicted GNAT family N-acyltransferase